MLPEPLSLDDFIEELNARLRLHPKYREGMVVTRDPLATDTGGSGSYTFTWPRGESDETQAWFDARDALSDIELEMRGQYQLAGPDTRSHPEHEPSIAPAAASSTPLAAALPL